MKNDIQKKTEKIPTHYYPTKQHVLHCSATEIPLGKTVTYSVKMHCTHCNNWYWSFPMMLAYPPDRCYDRNTPWETSQWQGIVQEISNFPSLEARKCKALPPGRRKAGIKSQHKWDQAQSSAWTKSQPALCCFGKTWSCPASLCWQAPYSFST